MTAFSLRSFVERRGRHDDARRLEAMLDRIIPRPALHARFVNTLARLEYVGVRKMVKSRRAERLDLDGLQHLLDEAVHALRLKKAAVALGQAGDAGVATFSDADTLAGEAGEAYFQALDRRAEAALATLDPDGAAARAEANYLLTSAAIEVRAQAFYPIYERRLREHGAPFSVSAITKDEDRHLEEMSQRLGEALAAQPNGAAVVRTVLEAEEALYGEFLSAAEAAIAAADTETGDRQPATGNWQLATPVPSPGSAGEG